MNDTPLPCRECGEPSDPRKAELCFTCDFWLDKVADRDNPRWVRAGGRNYSIVDERARGDRGFGGLRFVVTFEDGRVVETTNLWSQGQIPERFRDRLPDNADLCEAA